MIECLKQLVERPSQENLNKIKFEIERSQDIIEYYSNEIKFDLMLWTDKKETKHLKALEMEREFLKEALEIRNKIATILNK